MNELSQIENARTNMVKQQLRAWKVLNQRILDTFHAIPREAFISDFYKHAAFAETRIPLEAGDRMFFPALEGRILQEVNIEKNESVLIVGTGSGFLTACAAHLGKEVTSVDLNEHYIEKSRYITGNLSIPNITYKTLDIAHALNDLGTFDVIILTGSLAEVPTDFFEHLNENGRLFAFVGNNPATQATTYFKLYDQINSYSAFDIEMERLYGFEDKPVFIF